MQTIKPDSHSAAALVDGRDAFEAVVVPLMADAYRTALRYARQPDDADDLTQEALLRALRGFRHFVPGTNARAWLRTIVHSVFLTHCRRRQRQPEIGDINPEHIRDETGITVVMPLNVSSTTAAGEIADPRIQRALECLPSAFREAVWLVDIDELTYEEAAAALRCPLNTLRSRLFRGRRHLARLLRKESPDQVSAQAKIEAWRIDYNKAVPIA
jgi:RNA polymerase sigma-70 factor (ECF subfamily)